jgi:hypothetical protein
MTALRLVDEAPLDSETRQIRALGDPQLPNEVRSVKLYGLYTDEQLFRDFTVGSATGEEDQDLTFTLGQRVIWVGRFALGMTADVIDQDITDSRI